MDGLQCGIWASGVGKGALEGPALCFEAAALLRLDLLLDLFHKLKKKKAIGMRLDLHWHICYECYSSCGTVWYATAGGSAAGRRNVSIRRSTASFWVSN